LRVLAVAVDDFAGELTSLAGRLSATVDDALWLGIDAHELAEEWNTGGRAALIDAAEALRRASAVLRGNADQQDHASAAEATTPPGTTLPGTNRLGGGDPRVADMERALRDAGLLTGPPVSGYYQQWLENAVSRGVPIDTIKKIVAEHDITPEDFKVLDGMEEIREDEDGDGIYKSYFLLPTDISGEDAAKAVRMTYILNAGTDYGTEGEATDFAPTPYGSEELRRIAERQQANSWSYDDDVGFVHGNGGRLVTTPNGMMMGLGGNLIQDMFSQRGGTTWGDTFMLNIDDPNDPADQLRQVVTSGQAWYEGDNGPYQGRLDADRLLHHEERHSQQWAREGYTGFLASYAWEQITGGNETEEDAGLSDGGY
jgi:hypothetical protein